MEFLGDKIYEAYCRVRKEQDPNFTNITRGDPVYDKAAEKCQKLKALPEDYVRAQAVFCTQPKFYPNQLATRFANTYYHKYMDQQFGDAKSRVVGQLLLWVNQVVELKRDPKRVVMDESLEFYPWFRIIVSPEYFPGLEQKYLSSALATYHPAYGRHLEKCPGIYLERLHGKSPVRQ